MPDKWAPPIGVTQRGEGWEGSAGPRPLASPGEKACGCAERESGPGFGPTGKEEKGKISEFINSHK